MDRNRNRTSYLAIGDISVTNSLGDHNIICLRMASPSFVRSDETNGYDSRRFNHCVFRIVFFHSYYEVGSEFRVHRSYRKSLGTKLRGINARICLHAIVS